MSSVKKSEKPDNPKKRSGQRRYSDNPVGNRIIEELGGRTRKWLAQEAGVSDSTISDCIERGVAKAETAVAIARAFGRSVDWLLTGENGPMPRTGEKAARFSLVEDAEWVMIPEFDLAQLVEDGKGPIVSETPFRRDWLQRTLTQSSGIWIAKLTVDYEPEGLRVGAPVFLRDVVAAELTDRNLCIFRVNEQLMMGRFSPALEGLQAVAGRQPEFYVRASQIGVEEGQFVPVARVLGVPVRRL